MNENQGVDPEDWRIDNAIGSERRSALENPPSATELLRRLSQEGEAAAHAGHVELTWQTSGAKPGYARIECHIPLSDELFDQLFNGRTGYRAQYYRSPGWGAVYNRKVVLALSGVVKIAYAKHPLDQPFEVIERSLLGCWSKIWVVGDGAAFLDTPAALRASRWVKYWQQKQHSKELGLRIPLPPRPQLDLKGTFIHPLTRDEWIDETKIDRNIELYRSGWS